MQCGLGSSPAGAGEVIRAARDQRIGRSADSRPRADFGLITVVPFVSQLTQNWLPSGSAMTVQTEPDSLCWATRVAPNSVSRATASARGSPVRSRCIRFLPTLVSGTRCSTTNGLPSGGRVRKTKSPNEPWTDVLRTADQNAANRPGSTQSIGDRADLQTHLGLLTMTSA